MPKRTDIHKILIIGSGPIIIGQACEFDYSGTQACRALKDEGFEVILVNSNPATIMTDPEIADKTYIEPLTIETVTAIIEKERPDALLPTVGGQTALNLSVELFEKGILDKFDVKLIGANINSIKVGEDRELFKKAMDEIGIPSPQDAQARHAKALASGDSAAIALGERGIRNAVHYDNARQFARLVAGDSADKPAKERMYIATGGGPGIMEAANRGAHEMGALTVGLNIALPHEQSANPYVTPSLSFKFHYFAIRKMHFMMRAKALVAFPGGFGTLDELFEVITLVQTRKAKPVPIVLFGTDYWKRLLNFDVLVEEGAISPEDLALFTYVDQPQAAWDAIRLFYGL